MANTLSYAKSVRTCLGECARVLKKNGHFVFGSTYCPDGKEWVGNQVNGDEVKQILIDLGLQLFYYRQSEKINKLGLRQTVHFFVVQKNDPKQVVFDPVRW